MRPTEILMSEHRVIERVLAVLDVLADRAAAGSFDASSAAEAIEFLRGFADRCHHGKEEERLFPMMERLGMPRDAGPTAVMRAEHEMGRARIRRMADAVAAHAAGDALAAANFAFEARGYAEFLREHIAKEDEVLFPMADRMLSPEAQQTLLASFDHAESVEMGEGTHERFLAIAERLTQRYGVTGADAAAKAHVCGCSHGR